MGRWREKRGQRRCDYSSRTGEMWRRSSERENGGEEASRQEEWVGKERMGCMGEGENDRRAQRGIHVALSPSFIL